MHLRITWGARPARQSLRRRPRGGAGLQAGASDTRTRRPPGGSTAHDRHAAGSRSPAASVCPVESRTRGGENGRAGDRFWGAGSGRRGPWPPRLPLYPGARPALAGDAEQGPLVAARLILNSLVRRGDSTAPGPVYSSLLWDTLMHSQEDLRCLCIMGPESNKPRRPYRWVLRLVVSGLLEKTIERKPADAVGPCPLAQAERAIRPQGPGAAGPAPKGQELPGPSPSDPSTPRGSPASGMGQRERTPGAVASPMPTCHFHTCSLT